MSIRVCARVRTCVFTDMRFLQTGKMSLETWEAGDGGCHEEGTGRRKHRAEKGSCLPSCASQVFKLRKCVACLKQTNENHHKEQPYLHTVHLSSCRRSGWRAGSGLSRRRFYLHCSETGGPGPHPESEPQRNTTFTFSIHNSEPGAETWPVGHRWPNLTLSALLGLK